MSTSGAGGSRVRDMFSRAASADSLAEVIFTGIGAVLMTSGTVVASGIFTVADLVIIPATALANAAGYLIEAIFGGGAQIIDMGAITSALSISPGAMFDLGPLTFALGIASVLAGLYLLVAYLSEEPTGNFVPGIPFDIPTPGFQGPEEDDEGN